jgi:ATP-dependent helicase/nuclease subunit A
MTVHGAKGLEADIVILPDTTTLPDSPGKRGNLLYTEDGIVFPLADGKAPQAVKAAKAAAEAEAQKEHRRLLYVALTRAKDRLYICGFENKKGVSAGSWYELMQKAAQSIGVAIVRGDGTLHVIGDADMEGATATQTASASILSVPDWARKPPPQEVEALRLIRPSDAVDGEEPAVLPPLTARKALRFRRGLLVHTMLARLPSVTPEKRRDIAHAFLAARGVVPEEADALAAETLAVIEHPDFAAAFSGDARAEVAIVAELPELGARINGRIDRLAVTDSEVLAVDFKTNRPPPGRAEDVAPVYIAQMALYRAALTKVFPDRRIACALVWTEGPRLMELPMALLDAEILRIRTRLDSGAARS